ncbi:MAG TPA: hypothetical protein VD963_00925 [Phycisphaerales bacterium]|nr:hypothetical protein [Phycisphaerales bacterium]
MMRLGASRRAVVGVLALAGVGSASAQDVLTYDAALGTLPQGQGWTYSGAATIPMSVSDGQLHHGPTTYGGTSFWMVDLPTGTMDFAADTWSISALVQIDSGTFGNQSGFRRGGFNLGLNDNAGRWIHAEMNHAQIGIRNDNTGLSDPAVAFDLADGFHTVMLVAGPGGGSLLVDGVTLMTLPLGTAAGADNRAHFGDSTILGNYTGHIREVHLVPGPGALALLAAAAGVGARRRLRLPR